jgi:hypothetical protein
MGLKPSNVEASGTTVGRKLSKKNLMGIHSAGTPTKQESKLSILEHTYTNYKGNAFHSISQSLPLLHDDYTKRGKERTREINDKKIFAMKGKGGPDNSQCKYRGVRQRTWGK